jgi:hypothetical protein
LDRETAINILEQTLETAEKNGLHIVLLFSRREALKVAIKDMKTIQSRIDKRKQWKENVDNMTEQDWRESMEASKDAWQRD